MAREFLSRQKKNPAVGDTRKRAQNAPQLNICMSQRESHERESKGTRGLIALLLQVAIDFPYLKSILQGVQFEIGFAYVLICFSLMWVHRESPCFS